MTDATPSANFPPLVSRSAAGEAIARALRVFVGRGRKTSVRELEIGSGVPARSIECAMIYDSADPEWRALKPEHLLSLCTYFGPEFTTLVIAATCNQGAYALPDGDPRDDALATVQAAIDLAGNGPHAARRAAAVHLATCAGQVLRAA